MSKTLSFICCFLNRVTDLSNGSHKFKVETNAKQLFMTGAVVLFQDINVVVVEGGPKQQKKYRQLMLKRIKWVEEARANSKCEVEPKCQLVWEGSVLERNFGEVSQQLSFVNLNIVDMRY